MRRLPSTSETAYLLFQEQISERDHADMAEDFLDAHDRHWEDAERLYGDSRWANADHLYGISAECGLKRLIMVLQGSSNIAAADRRHIMEPPGKDSAWDRFESYRSGHAMSARFSLPPSNPFSNWNINQRYEHQGNFSLAVVDPHKAGAAHIRSLINNAMMDGLL